MKAKTKLLRAVEKHKEAQLNNRDVFAEAIIDYLREHRIKFFACHFFTPRSNDVDECAFTLGQEYRFMEQLESDENTVSLHNYLIDKKNDVLVTIGDTTLPILYFLTLYGEWREKKMCFLDEDEVEDRLANIVENILPLQDIETICGTCWSLVVYKDPNSKKYHYTHQHKEAPY